MTILSFSLVELSWSLSYGSWIHNYLKRMTVLKKSKIKHSFCFRKLEFGKTRIIYYCEVKSSVLTLQMLVFNEYRISRIKDKQIKDLNIITLLKKISKGVYNI